MNPVIIAITLLALTANACTIADRPAEIVAIKAIIARSKTPISDFDAIMDYYGFDQQFEKIKCLDYNELINQLKVLLPANFEFEDMDTQINQIFDITRNCIAGHFNKIYGMNDLSVNNLSMNESSTMTPEQKLKTIITVLQNMNTYFRYLFMPEYVTSATDMFSDAKEQFDDYNAEITEMIERKAIVMEKMASVRHNLRTKMEKIGDEIENMAMRWASA